MSKRFKFPFKMDLGIQILALYALFVVPIRVSAQFFDSIAGNRLENEVKSADLALARAISQETETAMRNSLVAVEQLSKLRPFCRRRLRHTGDVGNRNPIHKDAGVPPGAGVDRVHHRGHVSRVVHDKLGSRVFASPS